MHSLITLISLITTFGFQPEVAHAKKETHQNTKGAEVIASQNSRASHVAELLGNHKKKNALRQKESKTDIRKFVTASTKRFLPKKFKDQHEIIAQTILSESEKYSLDPLFLMAVILNESSFSPSRVGAAGEVGLMQLMPKTAEWIAKLYHYDVKDTKNLHDPVLNIKIGTAYFNKLRQQFDSHSRLYVSAYNIGSRKVRNLVSEQKIPKEYVLAVMKRYIALCKGFKMEGNLKKRSDVAWNEALNVTRKN